MLNIGGDFDEEQNSGTVLKCSPTDYKGKIITIKVEKSDNTLSR